MGENLHIAIYGINAVGDCIGPASGAAHEYSINRKILTVVHAQVPAPGSAAKDADILAGASDLAIDQCPSGDIDCHVVFQSDLACIVHAGAEEPDSRSIRRGDFRLEWIGEHCQIRIPVNLDVQFPRTVDLECQFVIPCFSLNSGADRLDGVLIDLVLHLYRDGLRTVTGEVGDMKSLHAFGANLFDPDRYIADSQ